MTTLFTPSHRGGSGSPLVCIHGFTDTWRSWELILPALEARHDVFVATLPGHAGGPDLTEPVTVESLLDQVEAQLDDAGIGTAHLVGNSLGGFAALKLAERGRAESVVALAPAGGWALAHPAMAATLDQFRETKKQLTLASQHFAALVATPEGRQLATALLVANSAHIPTDLITHLLWGVVGCNGMEPLIAAALAEGWTLDAAAVDCPVRIVWGTGDQLLQYPSTARRFREDWFPTADWVELDGIGHMPQLDVPTETAELILSFTA